MSRKLTRDEFRKVERWLHNIRRIRVRLPKLEESLEKMRRDFKEAGISISAVNYDRVVVQGGEKMSQEEKWVLAQERFNALTLQKIQMVQDLEYFDEIMSELENKDPIYGKIYVVKYGRDYCYENRPSLDDMVKEVGCSRETFLRRRRTMVERFSDYVLNDNLVTLQ